MMLQAQRRWLVYKCTTGPLCDQLFFTGSSLKRHQTRHHPNTAEWKNAFCCGLCDKEFGVLSSLEAHAVQHYNAGEIDKVLEMGLEHSYTGSEQQANVCVQTRRASRPVLSVPKDAKMSEHNIKAVQSRCAKTAQGIVRSVQILAESKLLSGKCGLGTAESVQHITKCALSAAKSASSGVQAAQINTVSSTQSAQHSESSVALGAVPSNSRAQIVSAPSVLKTAVRPIENTPQLRTRITTDREQGPREFKNFKRKAPVSQKKKYKTGRIKAFKGEIVVSSAVAVSSVKELEIRGGRGLLICEVCGQVFVSAARIREHFTEHPKCFRCLKHFSHEIDVAEHSCVRKESSPKVRNNTEDSTTHVDEEVTTVEPCSQDKSISSNPANPTQSLADLKSSRGLSHHLISGSETSLEPREVAVLAEASSVLPAVVGQGKVLSTSKATFGQPAPSSPMKTCPACCATFPSSVALLKHTLSHKPMQFFQCTTCEDMFTSRSSFADHLFQCQSQEISCDKAFSSLKGLQVQEHHRHSPTPVAAASNTFSCPECEQVLNTQAAYVSHLITHAVQQNNSDPKSLQCQVCSSSFYTSQALKKHVESHKMDSSNIPVPCPLCNETFASRRALVSHQKKHFYCPFCDRNFASRAELDRHNRETHQNERPWICNLCNASYKLRFDLIRHELKHAGKKFYVCSTCGRDFYASADLKQHEASVHSVIPRSKPFMCSQCGKKFFTRGHLNTHRRSHSTLQPFQCSQCPVRCKTSKNLQIHVRRHTGELPIKCKVCGEGFVDHCYLGRHLARHKPAPDLPCHVCSKAFYHHQHLKQHLAGRHFVCFDCEGKFPDKKELKQHQRECPSSGAGLYLKRSSVLQDSSIVVEPVNFGGNLMGSGPVDGCSSFADSLTMGVAVPGDGGCPVETQDKLETASFGHFDEATNTIILYEDQLKKVQKVIREKSRVLEVTIPHTNSQEVTRLIIEDNTVTQDSTSVQNMTLTHDCMPRSVQDNTVTKENNLMQENKFTKNSVTDSSIPTQGDAHVQENSLAKNSMTRDSTCGQENAPMNNSMTDDRTPVQDNTPAQANIVKKNSMTDINYPAQDSTCVQENTLTLVQDKTITRKTPVRENNLTKNSLTQDSIPVQDRTPTRDITPTKRSLTIPIQENSSVQDRILTQDSSHRQNNTFTKENTLGVVQETTHTMEDSLTQENTLTLDSALTRHSALTKQNTPTQNSAITQETICTQGRTVREAGPLFGESSVASPPRPKRGDGEDDVNTARPEEEGEWTMDKTLTRDDTVVSGTEDGTNEQQVSTSIGETKDTALAVPEVAQREKATAFSQKLRQARSKGRRQKVPPKKSAARKETLMSDCIPYSPVEPGSGEAANPNLLLEVMSAPEEPAVFERIETVTPTSIRGRISGVAPRSTAKSSDKTALGSTDVAVPSFDVVAVIPHDATSDRTAASCLPDTAPIGSVRLQESAEKASCLPDTAAIGSVRLQESAEKASCLHDTAAIGSVRLQESAEKASCLHDTAAIGSVRLQESAEKASCLPDTAAIGSVRLQESVEKASCLPDTAAIGSVRLQESVEKASQKAPLKHLSVVLVDVMRTLQFKLPKSAQVSSKQIGQTDLMDSLRRSRASHCVKSADGDGETQSAYEGSMEQMQDGAEVLVQNTPLHSSPHEKNERGKGDPGVGKPMEKPEQASNDGIKSVSGLAVGKTYFKCRQCEMMFSSRLAALTHICPKPMPSGPTRQSSVTCNTQTTMDSSFPSSVTSPFGAKSTAGDAGPGRGKRSVVLDEYESGLSLAGQSHRKVVSTKRAAPSLASSGWSTAPRESRPKCTVQPATPSADTPAKTPRRTIAARHDKVTTSQPARRPASGVPMQHYQRSYCDALFLTRQDVTEHTEIHSPDPEAAKNTNIADIIRGSSRSSRPDVTVPVSDTQNAVSDSSGCGRVVIPVFDTKTSLADNGGCRPMVGPIPDAMASVSSRSGPVVILMSDSKTSVSSGSGRVVIPVSEAMVLASNTSQQMSSVLISVPTPSCKSKVLTMEVPVNLPMKSKTVAGSRGITSKSKGDTDFKASSVMRSCTDLNTFPVSIFDSGMTTAVDGTGHSSSAAVPAGTATVHDSRMPRSVRTRAEEMQAADTTDSSPVTITTHSSHKTTESNSGATLQNASGSGDGTATETTASETRIKRGSNTLSILSDVTRKGGNSTTVTKTQSSPALPTTVDRSRNDRVSQSSSPSDRSGAPAKRRDGSCTNVKVPGGSVIRKSVCGSLAFPVITVVDGKAVATRHCQGQPPSLSTGAVLESSALTTGLAFQCNVCRQKFCTVAEFAAHASQRQQLEPAVVSKARRPGPKASACKHSKEPWGHPQRTSLACVDRDLKSLQQEAVAVTSDRRELRAQNQQSVSMDGESQQNVSMDGESQQNVSMDVESQHSVSVDVESQHSVTLEVESEKSASMDGPKHSSANQTTVSPPPKQSAANQTTVSHLPKQSSANQTTMSPLPKQSSASQTTVSSSLPKQNSANQTTVSPLPKESSANQTTVSDLPKQNSANQTTVSPVPKQSSANQTTVSPLPKQNSANQTTVSPVPKQSSANQAIVSPLPKQNSANQTTVSPLPKESSANQTTVSDLPKQSSANQTTVSPLPKQNSANQTTVSPVLKQSSASQATVSPLPKESSANQTTVSDLPKESSANQTTVSSLPKQNSTNQITLSPGPKESSANQTTVSHLSKQNSANQTTVSPLPKQNSANQTTVSPLPKQNSANQTTVSPVPNESSANQTTVSHLPKQSSANQTTVSPVPKQRADNQTTGSPLPTQSSDTQKTELPPPKRSSSSAVTYSLEPEHKSAKARSPANRKRQLVKGAGCDNTDTTAAAHASQSTGHKPARTRGMESPASGEVAETGFGLDRPFQCDVCSDCFSSSAKVQHHLQSAHSRHEFYQCLHCADVFSSLANLTAHFHCHAQLIADTASAAASTSGSSALQSPGRSKRLGRIPATFSTGSTMLTSCPMEMVQSSPRRRTRSSAASMQETCAGAECSRNASGLTLESLAEAAVAIAERRDAARAMCHPSPDLHLLVPKSPSGFHPSRQKSLPGLSQLGENPSGFVHALVHKSTLDVLSSGLKSAPGFLSSSPKSTPDKTPTSAASCGMPAAGARARWEARYTVAGQTYTITLSVPVTNGPQPQRPKDQTDHQVVETCTQHVLSPASSSLGSLTRPTEAKPKKRRRRGRWGDEGTRPSSSRMEESTVDGVVPASSVSSLPGSSALKEGAGRAPAQRTLQSSPRAGEGDVASSTTQAQTVKPRSLGCTPNDTDGSDDVEIVSGDEEDDDLPVLPRSFSSSPVERTRGVRGGWPSKRSVDVAASSPKRPRLAERGKIPGTVQASGTNGSLATEGRASRNLHRKRVVSSSKSHSSAPRKSARRTSSRYSKRKKQN